MVVMIMIEVAMVDGAMVVTMTTEIAMETGEVGTTVSRPAYFVYLFIFQSHSSAMVSSSLSANRSVPMSCKSAQMGSCQGCRKGF